MAFPFLFSHWIKRCLTLNEDADKIRRLKNSIFGLGRRLVASSFEEYSHTCLQFHKWSLWTEAIPVSVTVAVTALCWQFSPHSVTVDHSSKKMINVKEWQSFNQIQIFVPIKRARQASLLLCCVVPCARVGPRLVSDLVAAALQQPVGPSVCAAARWERARAHARPFQRGSRTRGR